MHRAVRTSSLAFLCAGFTLGLPVAAAAADFAQVYQDALANDPTYQQANATYMAAREARPEAWAALLPQISGSAGRSLQHSSGLSTNIGASTATGAPIPSSFYARARTNARQWSLNLSQELFSWTDWMTLKAADSQVAEAQATYQAAAQNLILRVATAYFNVLAALDTLQAQESSLKAFDLQLEQANKRFEVGLIAITDVEQARAARDTAAAAVIAGKQSLASAENQLEVITGRQYDTLSEPGTDMPLVRPNPASQDQWVQTSLQQNLSLIASRLAADVARDNVRIAFGGHLPTVSLVASRSFNSAGVDESIVGLGDFNLPSWTNDRQIGLEVTVPIFSGGGTQARVHQAQYQWIAAKDAVEQASRSTVQQARDAYLGVISGIAHVQALQQAMTSSQTAYRATEAGYRVGTQTEVDVLNALSTLVQAKTNFASSRYAYITSVVQLRFAAGTLDANEVQAINHWLGSSASVSLGAITPESMTPPAPAPTPKPPPAPPPPPD